MLSSTFVSKCNYCSILRISYKNRITFRSRLRPRPFPNIPLSICIISGGNSRQYFYLIRICDYLRITRTRGCSCCIFAKISCEIFRVFGTYEHYCFRVYFFQNERRRRRHVREFVRKRKVHRVLRASPAYVRRTPCERDRPARRSRINRIEKQFTRLQLSGKYFELLASEISTLFQILDEILGSPIKTFLFDNKKYRQSTGTYLLCMVRITRNIK